MALKDFPGYTFSKYSDELLQEFMKSAANDRNEFCNMKNEEIVTKLVPPVFTSVWRRKENGTYTSDKVKETEPMCIIIDDSDEESSILGLHQEVVQDDAVMLSIPVEKDLMISKTEDLTALIAETLEAKKLLSSDIYDELRKLTEYQIKEIFIKLSACNIENIITFGESLLKMGFHYGEPLIFYYAEMLLIQKISKVYNASFEKHVNDFAMKYPDILYASILKNLISNENVDIKVISQYISSLPFCNKIDLFKIYLHEVDKLQEQHIGFIEVLLSDKLDLDLLRKLVELMSNDAEALSKDKAYGKLLHKVLQHLGSNAKELEQPLKYIIGRHESVWKVKIKKLFDSNFSDSMLLTQSIRY